MALPSDEARVILALEAIQNDPRLSIRAVAKSFEVNRMTLTRRRTSRATRRDTSPKSRKLTKLEEEAIIQYILELGTRSFPPRLRDVEDMANQLLYVCDVLLVRVNWSSNFVKR